MASLPRVERALKEAARTRPAVHPGPVNGSKYGCRHSTNARSTRVWLGNEDSERKRSSASACRHCHEERLRD